MRSTKIRGYALTIAVLLIASRGWAQYTLHITAVDRDSLFLHKQLGLTTSFRSRDVCTEYIYTIPGLLQSRGYLTASLDSIASDSAGKIGRAHV